MGYKIFSLVVRIKVGCCWCQLEELGFSMNKPVDHLRVGSIIGQRGQTWRSAYSNRLETIEEMKKVLDLSIFVKKGLIGIEIEKHDYFDFFQNIDGNGAHWVGNPTKFETDVADGLFYSMAISHHQHMPHGPDRKVDIPGVDARQLEARIKEDNCDPKVARMVDKVLENYHTGVGNCHNPPHSRWNMNVDVGDYAWA